MAWRRKQPGYLGWSPCSLNLNKAKSVQCFKEKGAEADPCFSGLSLAAGKDKGQERMS